MNNHFCNDCGSTNIKKVQTITDVSLNSINQIFKVFYDSINPTINYGNKTNREAAKLLIDKFGLEPTLRMAEYAVSIHGQKYAPRISTPYQLKEKIADLKAHYESNNQPKQNLNLDNL